MHRHKILRFNEIKHKFQFFPASVSGNVNFAQRLIDYVRSPLTEFVNDVIYSSLVAGNGGRT